MIYGRPAVTDLDYADDVVIFADLFDTLKDALLIFNEQSKKLGLHVNWSMTKLQFFSPWIPPTPWSLIRTEPVTMTDDFTYLGSTIASNNSSYNDVNCHTAIVISTMTPLSSIWASSQEDTHHSTGLTKSTKIPSCPWVMIDHPADHSLVILLVLRREQPKQGCPCIMSPLPSSLMDPKCLPLTDSHLNCLRVY